MHVIQSASPEGRGCGHSETERTTVAAENPKRRRKVVHVIPERYQAFLDGDLSVEDLDDEELTKGQLKDRNGNFTGKPPQLIPRDFHTAVVRELVARQERKLLPDLNDSYAALRTVRDNPRAAGRDRVTAAIYLIERVSGKIPEKTVVEATVRKWEQDLGGLMADVTTEE